MTPAPANNHLVSYPVSVVHDSREDLIAASGLLHAIHSQYATEGVFSVGAVLHVANVVDGVVRKLQLDEEELNRPSLPF